MSSEERVCFHKEGFVLFMECLRGAFGSAIESMVFHMSTLYGTHFIRRRIATREAHRTMRSQWIGKLTKSGALAGVI